MQNVLFQSKVKVELKKKVRSVEEGIENWLLVNKN